MNVTILRPRRSADQHRVVGLKYSDAMGLTERQKMLSGERYNCHDPELARMAVEARRRVAAFCASDPGDAEQWFRLLGQIFGRVERGVHIEPPLYGRCRGGGHARRPAGLAGRRNARESHPRSAMSSAHG